MKYAIEIIDGDCVETLEFPNGDQFTKKSERTYCGCRNKPRGYAMSTYGYEIIPNLNPAWESPF